MGHYGLGTLCAGGQRMGRPIIGITGELEAARWGNWIREAVVSPVSYTRAVDRAGGTPVILPPVPASHHQAVNQLGTGLLAVAWTSDQVVEALEVQGHRWGLGVQWSPEEGDDARLFEALVAAASTAAPPPAPPQPEVSTRSKRKRHAARSS